MKTLILILAFLIACTAQASPKKDVFCGKRITIMSYPFRFKKLIKALSKDVRKGESLLDAIARAGEGESETESCRWNRFFFLDSMLYFNQDTGVTRIEALEARDRFYREWLDTLVYREKTGFAEWEDRDLRGESLETFLAHGSQQFRVVEDAAAPFNRGDKDPVSQLKMARAAVHSMLDARTPFNSVMPRIAVADAAKAAKAVACVRDRLQAFECGQNLFDHALECAGGDETLALETLGVYSSQRLYLLRDLKGWLEQNRSQADFDSVFQVFKDGSEAYFMMETVANRCGGAAIVPPSEKDALPKFSAKSYHFWSEAFLTERLGSEGFAREDAVKAALEPAKRYKSMIRIPGVVFNLVLGRPLRDGTVGDYRQVIAEQKLGAEFGYDAFLASQSKKESSK